MKKLSIVILLTGIFIFMSCKDIEVFYPIPLSTKVKFIITASDGSFSSSLNIDIDSLYYDLKKELQNANISWDRVDRVRLEGAAYTIYDPSVPNTIVDGKCDISYQSPFVKVLTIDNVNFTIIEGIPQVDPLTTEGVDLLNQAWVDFLEQSKTVPDTPPNIRIGVRAEGSLNTTETVRFTMVVNLAVTAVVRTKQKTYDIFG